jgi:hypothetical protein
VNVTLSLNSTLKRSSLVQLQSYEDIHASESERALPNGNFAWQRI